MVSSGGVGGDGGVIGGVGDGGSNGGECDRVASHYAPLAHQIICNECKLHTAWNDTHGKHTIHAS